MKRITCLLPVISCLLIAACSGTSNDEYTYAPIATPTVDYIEGLDVYAAPHKDSFLNQLAMNYRSYAIYNARTSGYSEIGEMFANKAVAAFSGETPYPEQLADWPVDDEQLGFELHNGYKLLVGALENDAVFTNPEVAAEAQAKFDCWLSASASAQYATAEECRYRFEKAIGALDCGGKTVDNLDTSRRVIETKKTTTTEVVKPTYPETRRMSSIGTQGRARDGVIIINNMNVPDHLIKPEPVTPITLNQTIYTEDNSVRGKSYRDCREPDCRPVEVPVVQPREDFVSRAEFVDMMLALRAELATINARLEQIESDRMMIKVHQIPSEPTERVMEEVFEIQFDFDKAIIKPEYKELIRKLADTTQQNRNVHVTVVGHTDTSGSDAYNYALGERRAAAVAKILVQNGIPSSQIVTVSKGENDLKVPTGDGVPKRENRRATVNKETRIVEPGKPGPLKVTVKEY